MQPWNWLKRVKPPKVQRLPALRIFGNKVRGYVDWPYDWIFRPTVGAFVDGELVEVLPTRREFHQESEAWICTFDFSHHDLVKGDEELQLVCLEAGTLIGNPNAGKAGRSLTALVGGELEHASPWDCSGFLSFLGLSLADQVSLLYRSVLLRDADEPGLAKFVTEISEGRLSILDLRDEMLSSEEFATGAKRSAGTRHGHWIVWGGLEAAASHFALPPTTVSALGPLTTDGAGSSFLDSHATKSELTRVLAQIAVGPGSSAQHAEWMHAHSANISKIWASILERRTLRKARSNTRRGLMLFSSLMGALQLGDAGVAAVDASIGSKPGVAGTIFYGPYMRLDSGSFRLRVGMHVALVRGATNSRLTLEVVSGDTLFGWLVLTEKDFGEAVHNVDFFIPKRHASEVAPKVEFRLRTDGKALVDTREMTLVRPAEGEANALYARDWLPLLSVGAAGRLTQQGISSSAGMNGHVFFGPYRGLMSDNYLLSIGLDLDEIGTRQGELDISVVVSPNEVIASRRVGLDQLQAMVELLFFISPDRAEKPLEFRLSRTLGTSFMVTSVRVERVPHSFSAS